MDMKKDIYYIGVNDLKIDLFEGQYRVPNGMMYNSYLLWDTYKVIFDTVDLNFAEEWLNNIKQILMDENPDYLIIQHMEPDHSGSIKKFMEVYPNTTLVGNVKTFTMIQQFFSDLRINKKIEVKDGEVLEVGKHSLRFIFAPMVHWPEVMVTYDSTDHCLFSADAFGRFGTELETDWVEEARRYYFGIVGKYGSSVKALFAKIADKKIDCIYPLHGPILEKDRLTEALMYYKKWSNYEAEEDGVCIAYCSIYGNTKKAVDFLIKNLKGKYVVFDLARCDLPQVIGYAFKYSKLVLATPTYNGEVFPPMEAFLHGLIERNYQNRTVGMMENGSWAPMAIKYMTKYLEKAKNIHLLEQSVTIRSGLNLQNEEEIKALADALK